jgi:uncharacterized protein (DUF934 family)
VPDWAIAIAIQIPLVAVVAWAFTNGKVHSHAEIERHEADHRSELASLGQQVSDWRALYDQERADRIAVSERLATVIEGIKDIVDGVDELTKEVIRVSRRT